MTFNFTVGGIHCTFPITVTWNNFRLFHLPSASADFTPYRVHYNSQVFAHRLNRYSFESNGTMLLNTPIRAAAALAALAAYIQSLGACPGTYDCLCLLAECYATFGQEGGAWVPGDDNHESIWAAVSMAAEVAVFWGLQPAIPHPCGAPYILGRMRAAADTARDQAHRADPGSMVRAPGVLGPGRIGPQPFLYYILI